MAINKKKYLQTILYLGWKMGKEVRGKKKLAKLLYYLDFDYYEKYQKYFIGEKYRKLPMGPFPDSLTQITQYMVKNKQIKVKRMREWDGYNPTEIYEIMEKPDSSIFSRQEKKMLDRILEKYGHLSGKELENLTHMEAPYIGTKDKDEIAYELSSYRGTEF